MIWKTALTCLASVLAVSIAVDVADAKSKQRKRIATPVTAPWSAPGFQQPARMIEVKPGYWISSYGCVTDDGYGRRLPCDVNDSGGR
jgi:hypothetical protein